jgi:hypothetical protein
MRWFMVNGKPQVIRLSLHGKQVRGPAGFAVRLEPKSAAFPDAK